MAAAEAATETTTSRSSDQGSNAPRGFTAPRRPQHFDLNSNQGGAGLRLLTRDRSPFDCKDKGDLPKFNGRDQREFWRKKVSYFLCWKCRISDRFSLGM